MLTPWLGGLDVARIVPVRSRSISAENPDGRKSGGAQAVPGADEHCTPASTQLGRGWKVRPCFKNFDPGRTFTLADIAGPGAITHIWVTVLHDVHRWISLRVFYDDSPFPSIDVPIGDFFANGLDGSALINSFPIAVNPKGGMNSYWPMPFRKRIRIEVRNDGHKPIPEFFFQISYAEHDVPTDAGYLHAIWNRSMTTRQKPEHTILDCIAGKGRYVGTYMVWNQLSNGWWGEGEAKFFIDGDPDDGPTICGTGTEDYFGGAWGFVMNHTEDMRPTTFSTPFLGYPQAIYDSTLKSGPRLPSHALYRWHIPDPIHFQKDLRVTMQALGWWPTTKYQPLTDDIASTAFLYLAEPTKVPPLPGLDDRLLR
jgi:hypothetical protein